MSTVAYGRILPKLVLLTLATAGIYCLLELFVVTSNWVLDSRHLSYPRSCQPDDEGRWAIGMFRGSSPFDLKPVEDIRPRINTPSGWPVSNPVYTCAHVTDVASTFVADPFLWPATQSRLYMFFETKSLHNMQGDIGAAVSYDGGATFKHVGVVLDEPWHLSYPFVFEHEGQMYMLPEGSKSGTLRLYTTKDFPRGWTLDKVLIDEPLIDASPIQYNGMWYMFASNRNRKSQKQCRELEIWYSETLKGKWKLHPMSPVKEGVQGSRNAGRPIIYDGKLYRFAQDCGKMYGHKVRSFHVTVLNTTHWEEEEVPLGFKESRQGAAAWNGIRYHHIDPHQLPSGEWIATMDGDQFVSDYLSHRYLNRLYRLLPLSILITAIFAYAQSQGGFVPAYSPMVAPCAAAVECAVRKVLPPVMYQKLVAQDDREWDEDKKQKLPRYSRDGKAPGLLRRLWGWLLSVMERRWYNRELWVWLLYAGAAALAGVAIWWFVWTFCKLQILAVLMYVVQNFSGPQFPISVDGQYSKFSVIVMSHEARMVTLQAFVKHYSTCSSVGEIVVVWNDGKPPNPERDFNGLVPVRVRVEEKNSMNNRFQPDHKILHRAVLIMDDDLLMPCGDVERAFARWRQHPERITGFYARILEGDVPEYRCKQCEKHTMEQGVYNIILAGAAFVDREVVFEAYFSEENKKGREYVDRVFNCDDLLLNFLMASRLRSAQYVEWVRPTLRFDVGKLTSKRLSTGNFGPVRHQCLKDFSQMFDNPIANRSFPLNFDGNGRPFCSINRLGCVYL